MNEERDAEYDEHSKNPMVIAAHNAIEGILEVIGRDFDFEKTCMTAHIISLIANFFVRKVGSLQDSYMKENPLSQENEPQASKYFIETIINNLTEIKNYLNQKFCDENKDSNIVH